MKQQKIAKSLTRIRKQTEIDSLWDRVQSWRTRLEKSENFPVLNSLEESWRALDEEYGGIVERADKEHLATTPLEALFFYIELGFYPPPELLLALLDSWGSYLHGAGALSLEQVFLGPPKKKAGSHALRHRTWARYIHWGIQLEYLQKEGYTALQAAEIVSERSGGKPEPESVLRLVNKHFFPRRIKRERDNPR